MGDDVDTPPQVSTAQNPAGSANDYVSPVIERLGTLAELTQGGIDGPDDMLGGGGDEGSF